MIAIALAVAVVVIAGLVLLVAHKLWPAPSFGFTVVAIVTALVAGAALYRVTFERARPLNLVIWLGLLVGVVCFLVGSWLFWRNHALPLEQVGAKHTNLSNLAVALITGGAVAFALFAMQEAEEERAARLQEQEALESQRAAFALTLATEPDLTGFTPPRRQADGKPIGDPYGMRGAYLRGKRMPNATLSDVDLTRARMSFMNLSGSDMRSAVLDGANLRGSYLYYADLRCACLRGAKLMGADLRNVDLRGADLEDADLRWADLRGAVSDDDTRWPTAERMEGACWRAGETGCGDEARGTWGIENADAPIRPEPQDERGCEAAQPVPAG